MELLAVNKDEKSVFDVIFSNIYAYNNCIGKDWIMHI
jgi:hypothetical protein